MASFKETVLRMVASKELTAAQAMTLIERVRDARASQPAGARPPVAIIGMSGRFPGADDPETFWQNIRNGVDSVGELPRSRWNLDELYDPDPQANGKSYCKWGGFLEDIDAFDAPFFNISGKEAQLIDPQQRLFLEEASRALEHAGLSAAQVDGVRCGVFAGVAGGDFIHQISAEGITPDAYAFMGNASSILAGRISYHLNLKGPSLAIDTACSSSLVAIHLACESLALGTSELALAGGVCVLNTPNFFMAGSKAGMLSRRGACHTFDKAADGFVPAEGVGVIVLKLLDRALADGDCILGVIEGSAINQDGRTNGITAPSAPSQTALALEVYRKFGIDPSTIGYVEAHGTGTPLGDPIEIEALTAAFRKFTAARGFCAIGSSKTNIGHAMSASGMAGIIKVLKALQAGELPPSLHFEQENPAIGFATTPFRVNTEVEPWTAAPGATRRAVISSFGFSGTNAHLVIGQAPAPAPSARHTGALPFPVSAKSRSALRANCRALADWLERTPDAPLDSVSWTLLTGRNHYQHRVVPQASTRETLIALLRAEITDTSAGIPSPADVFGGQPPLRIPLPTYRFERLRHALGSATQPKRTAAPHPLLDHAGPDGFRSRWDTALPFVRDHRVLGEHIVPGACYLELALAATRATALEDVVFRTPLRIGHGGANVELVLEPTGGFTVRSGAAAIASGRISTRHANVQEAVDLDAWRSRDGVDVPALLAGFRSAGVELGPYCTGLHRLWLGEGEALAQLQLPAGESRSLPYYTLHPTLVDGGFQAAMALLARSSDAVLVPAAIGGVVVRAPLPAVCYAHVRLTGSRSFDLQFIDEAGALLASLTQFTVAALNKASEPALRFYRPEWVETPAPAAAPAEGLTLVVHAPELALDFPLPAPALDVTLGEASLSIGPGQWQVDASSPAAFEELLAGLKPVGRVVFLGGASSVERDVVALLHLLQALPPPGEGARPLPVVVCAPPEGAALLGFAQTVSREESQLRFAIIESTDPRAAFDAVALEEAGVVLAAREGKLLRRALAEHTALAPETSRFRRGGVYLIAGGSGGIGMAVARHIVARHGGRAVLLGRREPGADLPEGIAYRRVDVTDPAAVAAVVAETRARCGAIHGVIHAAMVLRDVRMRNMDAETLRAVLAPKLAGSEVLAELFAAEPLDFMAFFSSANSFFGNAGQSNYAAASMAQDAIARRLAATAKYPVRVINWGFWGDVGAVATPLHRQRALEHGIGAIGVEEGLRAMEACLSGDEFQLMPMKVEPATLARMGLLAPAADDEIAAAFAAVENHGRAALRRFIGSDGKLTLPVAPRYERLRAALEAIAAKPAQAPGRAIEGWTLPFAQLIDRCLAHYPEVLAGDRNPAEVLFPGGSTQWVAPLYRDNPIVDRYNQRAVQELVSRVGQILQQRDKVRIFEIGAGTGGTSRGVLEALAPHADRVEFVFSDLSAGLVRQAKNELGPRHAFARFHTFDAEREPADQGIAERSFDLLLASNVLHATRNIAACLRNAHRLLRDGGVLVLNESIQVHDFSTLTFGLTDGWWLYDDADARLPHSPLLDERLWRQALAECFDGVQIPAAEPNAPQAVFVATARAHAVARQVAHAVAVPARVRQEVPVPAVTAQAAQAGAPDMAQIEKVVRRHLAEVLSVGAADIDPERRFSELGVDSITGVDLVRRLNQGLRVELGVTVLYDHPSVKQLARHIGSLAPVVAPGAPAGATPEPQRPQPAPVAIPVAQVTPVAAATAPKPEQAIAVVGLAGRFPGARNAAEFWRDLRNGVCRTGEVPAERWDVNSYYDADPATPGKSPCKWGGLLEDIDKFDPAFFHMSGAEAEYTDPQQRLFVQEAWHALEDAGYSPDWLDGRRCGVYVGVAAGDYVHLMGNGDLQPQAFLGNGVSMLASRISYLLNLRGPALAVDTACSSSLLAVHLACQSIRSGECDLALAGGVFVSSTQSFHQLTGQLGMLSPHGLCRAFDEGADGFVPGEAVAAVVLRPLDAALRDGDFIYGVIAGSGANQDGHSNGITAPSATSQAELEAEVYQRAGIDPRSIGYVEAHGTGTRLGDPLEMEGLTRAFRRSTGDRQFCAIGSVKTNIGHAGPAAGVVGLIKVLLAMQHREIPPSLHFDRANGAIDFAASPFYVAADLQPWSASPMRAAVSAFGLSGTNVHVVVQEAPPAMDRTSAPAAPEAPLYVVSAMSEPALRERVAQLEAWLAADGQQYEPRDIAYTLAVGRKHHAHRAVLNASASDPLAARYLAGETIDWPAVYPESAHRRVPLPGYPFSRERYWVPDAAVPVSRATSLPAQAVLTYARRWIQCDAVPAPAPESVALLGGADADRVRLQGLLGVPVSRDPLAAVAIAVMPGFADSLEPYLDLARRAGNARRVVVVHRAAEHAAAATGALHASLRFVHPQLLWQTLETAGDPVAAIARELKASGEDAELRHRDGVREAHRAVAIELPRAAALRPGAVWWITGGMGRIGMQVARWLVERFDARVIVTGRHAPAQALGRNIEFMGADVADRAAMQSVREAIRQRHGALHGVIHAAGCIDAPLLTAKGNSRNVLAPKVDGVAILDELTRDASLDAFIMFSSLSAVVGDFGQCDYACANRYLEAFAQWRAARRPGRTLAIHWPLWADGGMRPAEADERRFNDGSGLESLRTDVALRVLEQALAGSEPVVAVACGDPARIAAALGERPQRTAAPERASLPASATTSSPDGAQLEQLVIERTASIVRLPVSKFTRDSRFSEVGLDSLYMKDLASALSSDLGIAVGPTAFFEHQTVAALAAHLLPAWSAALASRPAARRIAVDIASAAVPVASGRPAPAAPAAAGPQEPIAIVGMSGRFPQSADLAAYWAHLAAGDDCITEIPRDRWDWRDFEAGTGREHDKSVSRWGGFMPGISHFDSAFFSISPREAVFMDPQHRVFLQGVWSALEDAGIRPSSLAGHPVGVWAGAQPNEYMRLIGDAGEANAQAALGNTQTMLANRVSYWFDFRGPSQTVDTACSSSLVAVHRAVQSLRQGECELAIAGGVSAILSPDTYVLGSQLGMLSSDGRCKTFDRSANGYVKGEGVGVLLLKPLSRALADGNVIHGVIRATAEGHGGKASSLTAPNPQAQARLVFDAWKSAGVPIDSVSYIEAHGTGTELGDPIEVEALTTAFRKLAQEQGVSLPEGACGLGSVKSNIGHLEPAAGVAGLIKVLLAMRHGSLPPTLHVKDVNPYLKLEGSPFRLVRESTPWSGSPLRAGVSAFGFGGSNAHVALEAAPAPTRQDSAAEAALFCVVPLSAKTPAALRERVTAMCEHLEKQPLRWRDLVFTLQNGREPFEHSLSVGASSVGELLMQWRGWLGGASLPAVLQAAPLTQGRLIPLPTYPFARTHTWFNRQPEAAPPQAKVAPMAPVTPPPETRRASPVAAAASLADIRAMLAELLYLPAESIADDARFVDLGLDSILAVEFAKKLQDSFAIDLRATRLYDYSSVAELVAHIDAVRAQPRSGAAPDGPLDPAQAEVAPVVAAEPLPMPGAATVPLPDAGAALSEIRAMLADLLYLEPAAIDDDTPFVELGLDSILAVEFAKKLQDRYAIDLRATRLYDHACVGDLARWIASVAPAAPKADPVVVPPTVSFDATPAAAPAAAEPAVPPATVAAPGDRRDDDIAIVGMAARYAGANDVHALWRNLAAGVDSVADVPKERWSVDELYPHQTYCRKGGFIDGVDQFDPLFFKISPQEAEWMDPQQRLFLEQGWLALEDAGIPDRLSSGMRCAVFAGAGQGDYFLAMDPKSEASAQFGIGNVSSILAARLSYFLNLKGPAISLDTACSSSLVATHLAAQSLRTGECDLALAGGVLLMITPQLHVRACQTRMLSPQGHCKSFDAEANGFVPSEGVGVVVLKRLRDAIADGDRIHAVIRGSGTNQDGRTNGITAPSAKSQSALELDVYRRFGIDPSTITCVEAHGTGTELGDPIEVEALTEAFRHYTTATQYCAIGSVKSNIGHSMPAAGVGGLIKAALMLRERKIAPSLHCEVENPKIDFAASPFYVARELRDWQPPAGVPRRVAVSSFGFSGTNAHVVLEEWNQPPLAAPASQGPWSFVLSARTPQALKRRALQLADWLEADGREVALADIAFTLSERRGRLALERIVNAGDRRALVDKLRDVEGASDARLPPGRGRVVTLPPYPFDRRRFWVPAADRHPLIDDLQHGLFVATARKHLTAAHEMLAQHVVAGVPTLPGAAHVEMALAAGAELAPPGAGAPALRKVVWTRPFQSADETLVMSLRPEGADIRFENPYCRGTLAFATPVPPARISLHLEDAEEFSRDVVYAAFDGMGLHYGDSFRRIASLRRGRDRVIAHLELPADHKRYRLDPRVLDGALQSVIGFVLGRPAGGAMLPSMLESVTVHAPLTPDCLAVATVTGDGAAPAFDIAIVSPLGDVLVELRGFSARAPRPAAEPEKAFYAPHWKIVPPPPVRSGMPSRVLILHAGTDHGLASALEIEQPGATVSSIAVEPLPSAAWARLADGLPGLEQVVFLGGLSEQPVLEGAALDAFQDTACLALGAFVRAWAATGRPLPEIVIFTRSVFRVLDGDVIAPQGASLVGLAAVVGKEFTAARVVHFDLAAGAIPSGTGLAALLRQTAEGSLALRNGQYFAQSLEPLLLPARSAQPAAFRERGVYLIVGGGGGIGGALAQQLARDHHARIALVGRRPVDPAIAATLAAIEAAGGEAIYLQADAGNLAQLEQARDAALRQWGVVHGVMHAALALQDQTLARLDDTAFRQMLRGKGRGTCMVAQAFEEVALDWLLVFSSTIAFTRNPGQGAYTAASTLQDAAAAAWASRTPWPLKTINWGFWGEVGAVATDRHRAIARSKGVGSLTVPDAIDAISRVVACDLQQVAVIRLLSQAVPAPVWQRNEVPSTLRLPDLLPVMAVPMTQEIHDASLQLARVETLGRRLLGHKVHGLHATDVVPLYQRLVDGARGMALAPDPADPSGAAAEAELQGLQSDAAMGPFARLLSTALGSFSEVVTGRRSATDVLFPRGSSELVEAVYRGNPLAREQESLLGQMMAALADQPLSLIEVGAGTGAATRAVLDVLGAVHGGVDYHWTDLSRHFVRQAAQAGMPAGIRATYSVLDLERDPAAQGFVAGSYDVVLAANVIHATGSIAATLQRAKKLLKPGGLLVLSEMVGASHFAAMTFGLTEGWWKFQDPERRQPHSPLLSVAQWEGSLAEAGFGGLRVMGQGADPGAVGGPIVLVAVSDGWYVEPGARMDAQDAAAAAPKPVAAAPLPEAPIEARIPATASSGQDLEAVRSVVAALLHTSSEELDNDTPFEVYGVDSLVAIDIAEKLEPRYGTVSATLLQQHNTISLLAAHLAQVRTARVPAAERREPALVEAPIPATASSGQDLEAVRSVVAALLHTRSEELDNDTPFEVYGVDSLVAIDIAEKLEPRYGTVSATLFQQHNTISLLAAHLAQVRTARVPAPDQRGPALVTVRAEGSGPRTFWVHSVLGETDWVSRLAKHLPASWPVHALGVPFTRVQPQPFASLEAMAASYLAEVRAVQPHGPYILGGYSFGGPVAFEMARQLKQVGERVQALVLLDAFAPDSTALRSLKTRSWEGFLPRVIRALLQRSRDVSPQEAELDALTQRLVEVGNRFAPLLEDYRPEPCAMNTLLVRNRQSFIGPASPLGIPAMKIDDDEPDHGWTVWLGASPQLAEIDTDHFCMGLEPAIQEVAQRVADFLHPTADGVFNVVRGHVRRVLPFLDGEQITMGASLRELGANSLDRIEVATCTMEDLHLSLAPTQLAGVQNIAELVDVFMRHLRARADLPPAADIEDVASDSGVPQDAP